MFLVIYLNSLEILKILNKMSSNVRVVDRNMRVFYLKKGLIIDKNPK